MRSEDAARGASSIPYVLRFSYGDYGRRRYKCCNMAGSGRSPEARTSPPALARCVGSDGQHGLHTHM